MRQFEQIPLMLIANEMLYQLGIGFRVSHRKAYARQLHRTAVPVGSDPLEVWKLKTEQLGREFTRFVDSQNI